MSYWTNRQKQLNDQLEKDEASLKKRLSSFYDTEYAKLDKEIASYYQKYGTDNVIQYRTLMEKLPDSDRKLLIERMDEFAEKYPQYEDLIPIRKTIYNLNRLEGLQYSVIMQQLEIGAVNNEEITKHLEKNAMRGLNAATETLGFGKNFYANNPDITKLFVNIAWCSGKDFSKRIWDNTDKLANYLNTDIAQGFARGDSYEKLVMILKKRFDHVARNDAYRLIYTEGTYVMAESTMYPFTGDFTQYRISTVGDSKVCPICKGVSKEVFRIEDRQPGVNFPPFHSFCRCTFEIVVEDWDKWMDEYEKRHGSNQMEKIANRFNSDIIKMYRKGDTHRKRSPSGHKIIDKATYYKITNPAIKNGADIRWADDEWTRHLVEVKATAVTIGDVIYFREDATVSDVLEETYHFMQNKNGLNAEYKERERIILNEIDAKKYVLSMREKYNIPKEEIELTKNQLKSYKKEMDDLIKRGEWNV